MIHSRRAESILERRRVCVIIATDLACVALVLAGICGGLLTSCAMVEGDSNSFTLYRGDHASSPYSFSSSEPRLLTLTLTVNTYSRVTGDGYLDFYFTDSFNYNIYLHPELNQSLTYLVGKENAGYGVTMTLDSFSPVVGDTYYLVVDNTDTWGVHSVYQASGSYGLVENLNPPHVMSGHVHNSESAMPISGATVSIPDGRSAITDDSGYYSIGGLEDGTYTVTVSAPGMKTLEKTVDFYGADLTVDFALVPQGGGHAISSLGLVLAAAAVVAGLVIVFMVLRKKMVRRQVPRSESSGPSETIPLASSHSQRTMQRISALPSQIAAFVPLRGKGDRRPEHTQYSPPTPQAPTASLQQTQSEQASSVNLACPKCASLNPAGSRFCDLCGTKLESSVAVGGGAHPESRGQRRSLPGDDDEDFLRRLDEIEGRGSND